MLDRFVGMSADASLFPPHFTRQSVQTSGATINLITGGDGPPLLLLHGFPQTHIEWRKIAPALAKDFTVVMPDLRGYGDSSKPDGGENHIDYSKRAMARDQVELMTALGFDKFALVGHDRGARVGHRLALDHPERVSRLAVLDICPTLHMYDTANRQLATYYFHWFFLIQPEPFPETLIGNSVDAVLKQFMGAVDGIEPQAFAEYLRCFSDPATIHATCEDYRAAATVDLEHDRADLGEKITCPLLVLWGARGLIGALYDPIAVWRERASDVRGKALPGGHWLPEEVPRRDAGGATDVSRAEWRVERELVFDKSPGSRT